MLTDELGTLAARMWRRRTLIVLVMLLFGAASWYTVRNDDTIYTSKAALTVMSGNRAPDQDAVLSQGYADFFNDPLYQAGLRKQAGVPDGVTFEANTVLAGPLLYITASSTDARSVETASRRMADALRNEVNLAIQGTRKQEVEDLKAAFEDLRELVGGDVPDQAVVDLQERIGEITTDSSNKLQPVQLNSFVQSEKPPVAMTTALGLASGLVVGCALAVLLGAVSRRVESKAHLERRADLPVTAEVPPARNAVADAQLWTVLQAEQVSVEALLGSSSVIAVASPRTKRPGPDVPRRVAEAAARTGKTVLIDLRDGQDDERLGLTDWVEDERISTPRVLRRVSDSLWVVGTGSRSANLSAALDDPRSHELIEALRKDYSTIVLAPPGTLDSTDALPTCRLADDVVLVVEEGRSRVDDVVKSLQLLRAVAKTAPRMVMVQRGRSLRRQRSRGSETAAAPDGGANDAAAGAQLSRVP